MNKAVLRGGFFFEGSMAGSISLSLSQQLDTLGKPLSGGLLYFIMAGTTSTPQNAYKDTALTLPHPNPITLDSAGRIPAFYLADGQIKVRLTDKTGVQQIVQDNLLVIGPSSGGGGGGGVDATTIFSTGDIKQAWGTSTLSGWVRTNGRTIGSATSGATERANADTQALFVFLWADPNLVVSGGRGVSGLADFAANKTLQLPDVRGRVLGGLDDMGNSAAGRLTSSYFGPTAIVLGAVGGSESTAITAPQVPTLTSSGNNTIIVTGPNTGVVVGTGAGGVSTSYGSGATAGNASNLWQFSAVNSISVASQGTGGAGGGAASPHRTVQPTILTSIYIKL